MRYFLFTAVCVGSVLAFGHAGLAATTAHAVLAPTTADSKITGEVLLKEENGGLEVEANVENLEPGKHGFHIHENGSCAEAGKGAGGHFNPDKTPHGYMPQDGMTHSHPGDMGNLEAGKDGKAQLKIFLPGVSLNQGKYAVNGKSIVVHAKEDDMKSQPAGNAGDRIACGVIQE